MRLLASEIRRVASRRLLFWLVLSSLGFVVLLVVFVAARSNPDGLSDDSAMRTTSLWLSKEMAAAQGGSRDNVLPTISVLMYLLVIVLGASAIGAEYRAGTVTTMLTWETRRARLLLARLAAVAIVGMIFFVVIHAAFIVGWVLGVELNGRADGADAEFWRELVAVMARATVIAGVFAVLSGALATLGRNTAAAMGFWFGYLIAVEAVLGTNVPDTVQWFLIPNLAGFYEWDRVTFEAGQVVSPGAATARLALYLLVLGGLAVLVFRRRDVT